MTESTGSAPVNALDKFFNGLRGLGVRRRSHDKWIGGVCSGIADRLGVDPVIVRAVTVLLVLLGGVGVTAYLVAWLLLPDSEGRIMAERALRHGEGGPVVLLVVTGLAVFSGFPWWFSHNGFWGFPWGLLLLGGLIWWVVSRDRQGRPFIPPPPPGRPDSPAQPAPMAGMPGGPTGAAPTAAGPTSAGPTSAGPTSAGPGSGGSAPATMALAPPTGGSWAQQAGQPAGAWGQTTGERAGAWGQDTGERAGAWGQQVGTSFAPPPRRRSGGGLMTLVGIGLALVTYGVMTWLGDVLSFPGDHTVIALAGALGALGVLVLGLGIAGWRAGFLGFVTICLAIAMWTVAVFPGNLRVSGRVGDQTWRPLTVSSSSTYAIAVGDAVLDLTQLPADGLAGQTLPASVSVGQLTVIVPRDVTVAVDGHVGVGDITFPNDGGTSNASGSDITKRAVFGDGPTDLTIKAGVGFGEIKVVKE